MKRYLLTAVGVTLVGLLMIEIFLRLYVYGPGPVFAFDPDLGKRPAAGTRVLWGVEGHGFTRYVADGEIATPYGGSARTEIVVLGDSNTEAFQLDDDEKFVSVAETQLRRRGFDVDMHNLGFAGASIPDYIHMAAYVERHYAPSVIVVQLSRQDFRESESFDPARPSHFVLTADSTLAVEHRNPENTSKPFLRWFKRTFAVVNFGYYRYQEIQRYRQYRRQQHEPPGGAASVPAYAAFPAGERRRLMLGSIAEAYPGIPIVLLIVPFVPVIESGRLVEEDPESAEILAAARSIQGLSAVDPSSAFLALTGRGEMPRGFSNTAPGTGHLNRRGHEAVGIELAAALEELLR